MGRLEASGSTPNFPTQTTMTVVNSVFAWRLRHWERARRHGRVRTQTSCLSCFGGRRCVRDSGQTVDNVLFKTCPKVVLSVNIGWTPPGPRPLGNTSAPKLVPIRKVNVGWCECTFFMTSLGALVFPGGLGPGGVRPMFADRTTFGLELNNNVGLTKAKKNS